MKIKTVGVAVALVASVLNVGVARLASATMPTCATADHGATFLAVVTDSSSERGDRLTGQRQGALANFATYAAACRGHLTVVADPGLSVTTTVFNGTPYVNAPTPIAADHRTAAYLATTVLPKLQSGLAAMVHRPAPLVNQPESAFTVLGEYAPSTGEVRGLILTSLVIQEPGFNTNGPLSASKVAALSKALNVEHLGRHFRISIEGVGSTSDVRPAPLSWLQSLRALATNLCHKTGAQCSVTSEIVGQ